MVIQFEIAKLLKRVGLEEEKIKKPSKNIARLYADSKTCYLT